jgi:3-hydroxybutyryl-CoA dehydrogenase
MGKTVIDAADVAGFLVNRVNRPYSLTALRLLQEQVAEVATIDRIARLQGGFRMGPFELMDLIGLETNHAVAVAFQRQSFGEPRYQPSPLQARMVAAGRLGRKAGAGWYQYTEDARGTDYRPEDPELPAPGGGDGRAVVITGTLPIAGELSSALREAGFTIGDGSGGDPWLTLICGDGPRQVAVPQARYLWNTSLHQADPQAAGFHVLPPFEHAKLVEVTSTPQTDPVALARLQELIGALGRHAEPVADAPGLVLGRIVTALINEAAFLIGEGNGSAEDVDLGLTLGLNHPRGPVAWSHAIGLQHTVGLLDALHRELGEDRYRAAPLLRRRLALGEAGL